MLGTLPGGQVMSTWQLKKESIQWSNTLVLLPAGTIYRGTLKHYSVVSVLKQVYHRMNTYLLVRVGRDLRLDAGAFLSSLSLKA